MEATALLHHGGRVLGAQVTDRTTGDVVFASKAGAPNNPAWYHNLKANPQIDVEYGTETFKVEVSELTGDERSEFYAKQVAMMPQFGEYEEKAGDRVIPVLALTRI